VPRKAPKKTAYPNNKQNPNKNLKVLDALGVSQNLYEFESHSSRDAETKQGHQARTKNSQLGQILHKEHWPVERLAGYSIRPGLSASIGYYHQNSGLSDTDGSGVAGRTAYSPSNGATLGLSISPTTNSSKHAFRVTSNSTLAGMAMERQPSATLELLHRIEKLSDYLKSCLSRKIKLTNTQHQALCP